MSEAATVIAGTRDLDEQFDEIVAGVKRSVPAYAPVLTQPWREEPGPAEDKPAREEPQEGEEQPEETTTG